MKVATALGCLAALLAIAAGNAAHAQTADAQKDRDAAMERKYKADEAKKAQAERAEKAKSKQEKKAAKKAAKKPVDDSDPPPSGEPGFPRKPRKVGD